MNFVTVEEAPGCVVVIISGSDEYNDDTAAAELRDQLISLANDGRDVTVDLGKLPFLSGEMRMVLRGLHRLFQIRKLKFRLCNSTPNIEKKLRGDPILESSLVTAKKERSHGMHTHHSATQ